MWPLRLFQVEVDQLFPESGEAGDPRGQGDGQNGGGGPPTAPLPHRESASVCLLTR